MSNIQFKVISIDMDKSDQKQLKRDEALLILSSNIDKKGIHHCIRPSKLFTVNHTFNIDDDHNEIAYLRFSINSTSLLGKTEIVVYFDIDLSEIPFGELVQKKCILHSPKDHFNHGYAYIEFYSAKMMPKMTIHPNSSMLFIDRIPLNVF